jgi:hypothetical protein
VFTYVKPKGGESDRIYLEYYALIPNYSEKSIMKEFNIALFSNTPIVGHFTMQFDNRNTTLAFLA